MTQEHQQFWETIADIPVCMVTTTDDTILRARPMAPFVDKDARTIRFLTDDDSAKITEILVDRDIGLSFTDAKGMRFASVSGRAAVSEDETVIRELWGPYCEVFFPDGPDSVSVITVSPSHAEYWDNSKGKLATAVEITKAYFSDQGPELGENAKIKL